MNKANYSLVCTTRSIASRLKEINVFFYPFMPPPTSRELWTSWRSPNLLTTFSVHKKL